MIKIKGIEHIKIKCHNEFDYYVPISTRIDETYSFQLKSYIKEDRVYYELTDEKSPISLIEFGIGRESKKLMEVVLTAVNNVRLYSADILFFETIYGWPLIEVDHGVTSEKNNNSFVVDSIFAYLTPDKLEIVIGNIDDKIKRFVLDENFELGANIKEEIAYMCFNNIDDENYELLKEAFISKEKLYI